MKPACQKDDLLLADIARARAAGRPRLWWLGQSGFLLVTTGGTILFDPYLSDSLTRKYAATDKPHTRITERVIAPERLTGIDVITSSHAHTDHLDPETLLPLLAANPAANLVIPRANRTVVLERLGKVKNPLAEIDAGDSLTVAGMELHGIPAAHNTVERDERGCCRFLGYIARLAGKTVYHSGDTLMHDGLISALAPFRPDVALVPINGNRPERRVAGNLDGAEAARLSRAIEAGIAIPHHFDMFEFNTDTPLAFEAECRRQGTEILCPAQRGGNGSVSFIRTVLGDIAPEQLGVCYAHEHIIIDPSYMTEKFPDFRLDSVDLAVDELSRFKADGGRAMVDSMPTGGRNAAKLAEVSHRSGVHIVCPTGLHLQKYYPDGHWGGRLSVEELAEVFIGEINDGIDANDLSGPVLKRLPQRAGLIKIASGLNGIDEHQRRIFQAAAIAHRQTGCPILTHTEQGTAALEQIALLQQCGVDLTRVTLSHTDRKPDLAYHRKILQSGVRIEFDSAFRWPQGNPTLDLLVALTPEFPDQIMLGMDAARASYWRSHGGAPGMSFLLTEFTARHARGGNIGRFT